MKKITLYHLLEVYIRRLEHSSGFYCVFYYVSEFPSEEQIAVHKAKSVIFFSVIKYNFQENIYCDEF